MIRFGPAGLGGVKEAVSNLERYAKLGLKACEIAFTYGVYIKESQEKEIKEIRETAEKLDIKLSIHAPYWINLNSKEKRKIEESKKRIIDCCSIGEKLNVRYVVFHPGYYGKDEKEKTYESIKEAILDILKEIKKNKWKIKLAPETTGKVNVFGSVDEILRLSRETGCFFCVDFAHVFAREQGKTSYEEIYEKFGNFPSLHAHFSGIEWGEKGERRHIVTDEKEIKELISALPKDKDITIVNESPMPVEDSVKSLKIYERTLAYSVFLSCFSFDVKELD